MIDFQEMQRRDAICQDIVNNRNYSLLNKQGDDILMPIIKHIIRCNLEAVSDYRMLVESIRKYSRSKKVAIIAKFIREGGTW